MGSPETEEGRWDDEYQHKVTITKPFYMQTTEVTQGQWKAVMGTEPWKRWFISKFRVKAYPNYPATYITWNDAVAFCEKLGAKEGKTYRLPTEAEWEYACRAKSTTSWNCGDDEKELGDYAWYKENTVNIEENHAHQVGLKRPNAFGLYDMHGNVWEWCNDYYGPDYDNQSSEQDPLGSARGSYRVLRGGSWHSVASSIRSAYRDRGSSYNSNRHRGFRVVCELD
jgi:formylglycine-generating enzyme required for sulfatase activity